MTRTTRWALVLTFLFLITAMVLVLVVLVSLSGRGTSIGTPPVLLARLQGDIPEQKGTLADLFDRDALDFRDVIDALMRAADDERIEGGLFEIGPLGLGWAQVEELHAAMTAFRESGKWATCFFETAGEFGGANGDYLLASACEEIVLAPPGNIGLNGLRVETPFWRDLYDKLGVVPQFGQRKEFKNAVNTYTERDYNGPHEQATLRLIESIHEKLVDTVSAGRGLTHERVRELIDGGPYTASEAFEHGLVDLVAYHDELIDRIESATGDDAPFIGLARYLDRGRPHSSGRRRIALVYAVGVINRGASSEDLLGGRVAGSDTIAGALREARERSDVDAVVLRVDSPGGSYVASDLIRREVELTSAEKPVVISMGNLAASGGYFVSMQGDRIFANENTLTGSIGVYAGKLVTQDLWREKIGINYSSLQVGENADFMSTQSKFDELAWERMNVLLDRVYTDFVQKAAEGRDMEFDELEPLAHGRVWTGRDALDRGLIDEIGGLTDALDEARDLAGLGEDEAYRVIVLPRPRGLFQMLFDQGGGVRGLPREVRQVLGVLHDIGLGESGERLLFDRSIPEIR